MFRIKVRFSDALLVSQKNTKYCSGCVYIVTGLVGDSCQNLDKVFCDL